MVGKARFDLEQDNAAKTGLLDLEVPAEASTTLLKPVAGACCERLRNVGSLDQRVSLDAKALCSFLSSQPIIRVLETFGILTHKPARRFTFCKAQAMKE